MRVARVDFAQIRFKCIYLLESEPWLTNRLNAFDHLEKPSSCLGNSEITKEECLFPILPNVMLRHDRAVLDDGDASNHWDMVEKDVATDPSTPSCVRREWLPLFDSIGCQKMLGDHEQIGHRQRRQIVIQQKEVGVGVPTDPRNHGVVSTIGDCSTERLMLALEFILFGATRAVEIRCWLIIREPCDAIIMTVDAIDFASGPGLGQDPDFLRGSQIGVGNATLEK